MGFRPCMTVPRLLRAVEIYFLLGSGVRPDEMVVQLWTDTKLLRFRNLCFRVSFVPYFGMDMVVHTFNLSSSSVVAFCSLARKPAVGKIVSWVGSGNAFSAWSPSFQLFSRLLVQSPSVH